MPPSSLERRVHEVVREVDPQLLHERLEVARPADRDRGGGEEVLEQQVPPDDPGQHDAERRVGVRVRGAGRGDHRRQLRVAERGDRGREAGDHERDDHGGPGVLRRGGARRHEDAGADDGGDAQRRQADRPIAALSSRPRSRRACATIASRFRSLTSASCQSFDRRVGDPRRCATVSAIDDPPDEGTPASGFQASERERPAGQARGAARARRRALPGALRPRRDRRRAPRRNADLAPGAETGRRGPRRRARDGAAPPRRPRLRRPDGRDGHDPAARRRATRSARRRCTTCPTSTSATGSARPAASSPPTPAS